MKKWSTPKMVTVSVEDMDKLMFASACPLFDVACDLIRVFTD